MNTEEFDDLSFKVLSGKATKSEREIHLNHFLTNSSLKDRFNKYRLVTWAVDSIEKEKYLANENNFRMPKEYLEKLNKYDFRNTKGNNKDNIIFSPFTSFITGIAALLILTLWFANEESSTVTKDITLLNDDHNSKIDLNKFEKIRIKIEYGLAQKSSTESFKLAQNVTNFATNPAITKTQEKEIDKAFLKSENISFVTYTSRENWLKEGNNTVKIWISNDIVYFHNQIRNVTTKIPITTTAENIIRQKLDYSRIGVRLGVGALVGASAASRAGAAFQFFDKAANELAEAASISREKTDQYKTEFFTANSFKDEINISDIFVPLSTRKK